MGEAETLDALVNTLALLSENQYDLSLHAQHVRLARETGLEEQIKDALEMVTTFWAAGDYVWLPLLDIKIKGANLDTAEDVNAVLSLFELAEADYMSIPLLQKHIEFILERFEFLKEQGTRPDDFEDTFTADWTLNELEGIVAKGAGHLGEGHKLWDALRDFMLEYLSEVSAEKKPELSARVESLLLEHMKQPHANNDETFQAYSSFTTQYKPADEYESLLVKASKSRAQAVKAYQRREGMEQALAQSGFSLEGYAYYIASERKAKKPDLFVLNALYERAIAEADKRRFAGEANAENALRTFWLGYIDTLRQHDADEQAQLAIFGRAKRSIPGCGELWARYIRFMERTEHGEDIDSIYSSAMSVSPLTADVDQLVSVVLAKASCDRHKAEDQEEVEYEAVLATLLEGVGKVRKASKTGDPQLRLEKYFSTLCTEVANMAEHAVIMWEDATKFYKTSYLAWLAHADVLVKQHLYSDARKIFRDVANKNLDWPEAVWNAWIQFEHVHGSVEELEDCLDRVERAREKVNAKRAKDAEKAAYQAMQVTAEQQAAGVPVSAVPVPDVASTTQQATEAPMDVDRAQPQSAASGSKRKAEDELVPEETKKPHTEPSPAPLKRDRENCTVFVAEVPTGSTEDDLRALFKDCGPIREIKITTMPNSLVATVEFMERESVPAALTKDKKRVHGEEIAVHLAWKSTLYVTNFPESADDSSVRELFGKYGVLFDVRWPSKKFKSTRRFCYVQYTSPKAAEAALELHGRELEPGRTLQVFISNPERRKERTDADANDRELHVAGLARSVKKQDLEKLFSTYGTVKAVRLGLDEKGQPKGYAFVEFEQEKDALAALAANNYELKNRRIAVTLSDSRVKGGKIAASGKRRPQEVRNRSVRIRGLPAATQEGLLQQTLEKIVKVRRVEVYSNLNEAVAECENAAEAGKLLLHPDPIVLNGHTLRLSEDSLDSVNTHRPAGPPATAGSGLFIPRSAASRPRAGLGSKKTANLTVSASTAGAAPSSANAASGAAKPVPASAKGQDDFRKMLGV
ncbi:RNA-binding protein Prp24 [Phanerochaete sordida]|uniref:U4/U6 snRNA-associated-splicing factor PRP24 n=1 Tax=Phanerochaete sordida TaxID=48140 RepID=A0A9P3LBG6_9APHY|nr:RNA-binding protein Prp24 [Phanerochaete sordida]